MTSKLPCIRHWQNATHYPARTHRLYISSSRATLPPIPLSFTGKTDNERHREMATTTITQTAPAANTEDSKQDTQPWTHKVPLRLKGVLDDFESFDTTPIIGKEFPTANLKEWLEADNSDDLLRDLAITSEWLRTCGRSSAGVIERPIDWLTQQSRNVALSSSASKTASTTTCRRNSFSGSANCPVSRALQACIFTL